MPRKVEEFDVLEKPKRAPRSRVANSVDDSEVKPKRTRSKTKTVVKEPEVVRKAPTPIAEIKREKRFARKHAIVIGVLMVIGVGSSAAIGLTDKGQIDIVNIIEERNKKAAERGEKLIVAEEELLPDGGLIPADPSTATPQATSTPNIASSTASSTPQGNIPRTAEEIAAEAQTESATST